MSEYTFKGEVHTNRARSMDDVVDVIANALEDAFAVTRDEYTVQVSGPPEVHIGVIRR